MSRPPAGVTAADRLFSRLVRRSTGCLEWTGKTAAAAVACWLLDRADRRLCAWVNATEEGDD